MWKKDFSSNQFVQNGNAFFPANPAIHIMSKGLAQLRFCHNFYSSNSCIFLPILMKKFEFDLDYLYNSGTGVSHCRTVLFSFHKCR